jgi:FkbM family methyltransferase
MLIKNVNEWALLNAERAPSFLGYASGKHHYDGGFREYEQAFKQLPNKRTAIDVGANYGFVTKFLSKNFQKVYSSEIIPYTRECLKTNVSRQGMNNVEVLDHGFSNENKTVDVFFNAAWSGHASVVANEASGSKQVSCPVKTIDSCGYEDVDYIKIDVEGQELEVLQGAQQTIKKCKPMISIEVTFINPEGLKRAYDACVFLESLNYKFISRVRNDYLYISNKEQ